MPAWGNKRFNKRVDALVGASSWRDFVVEALPTRESVVKRYGVIAPIAIKIFDNRHDAPHCIDIDAAENDTITLLSSQLDAMRHDAMPLPSLITSIKTKALDASGANLVATDEEMQYFCASSSFLARALVDSEFGAEENNWGREWEKDRSRFWGDQTGIYRYVDMVKRYH
jgi:hypothetical protein